MYQFYLIRSQTSPVYAPNVRRFPSPTVTLPWRNLFAS
ncbi:unnamed protein product [Angiostrongylus costaricensis]|uniref:Uncharacterized protein n=1 Tax=Angiostrongylus costaricensis TaxID=334426 RepID=A0A0R3PKC2_ANGCS|nr:unnamed protein product [Angiostrongylus costaricensis]